MIASCPDCGADLIDEGFSFWCKREQKSVSFARAAVMAGPDD